MGMVRATGNFREMPATIVRDGDLWDEEDPVVSAHPEWFERKSAPRRKGSDDKPVEQVTATPGEKRPTRRAE